MFLIIALLFGVLIVVIFYKKSIIEKGRILNSYFTLSEDDDAEWRLKSKKAFFDELDFRTSLEKDFRTWERVKWEKQKEQTKNS